MPRGLEVAIGEDHIMLVPRDPETAYVYWEITAKGVIRTGVRSTDPQFELRIRAIDDAGEPNVVFQVSIHRWLDGMFVPFGDAGMAHDAVIGVRDGRKFVPIATSQVLRSPRPFAGDDDTEFVVVELDERGLDTVPTTHENPEVGSFPPYQAASIAAAGTKQVEEEE